MQTIEDTAQAMFGRERKTNIQGLLMTYREIKNIIDGFRQKKDANTSKNYNFTGQHTDICFASDGNGVSIDDINNIEDKDLKNNVMRNYSDAVNDGYLDFDEKTGKFTLTEKGTEHINSEAFKEQFEKDQSRSLSNDKAVITLKGNKSDLNVFRYTNELKLNKISCSPQDYDNILSYFKQCEKYGLVTISEDNVIKPTEKCHKYLSQHSSANFTINKVTSDNIRDISNRISKQTAKKATEEVAKQTAKTAAKTGAKAAAGAATAGASVAVDAIIQLSATGAKALERTTDLNLKRPAQNRH